MKKYFSDSNTKLALILTVKLHNRPISNAKSFLEHGYNVIEMYSTPGISAHAYFQRLKYHLGFSVDGYLDRRDKAYNRKVMEVFDEYKPDIVYVYQGKQLLPDTIQYIQKKAFIVLSLIDKVSLFPEIVDRFKYYDLLSSYSIEDVEHLNAGGLNCHYFPATTDRTIYRDLNAPKTIDVSFVGAMYPDRREMLTRLVKDMPDVAFEFYGEYAPLRKPKQYLEWMTDKRLHACFKNRVIPVERVNEIYNASRICLNLNRSNAGNSWAGRFADIVATRSFQITTYNEYIDQVFGESVETFKDYEELKQKIRFYLAHASQAEQKGEASYDIYFDASNHLFIDRMRIILDAYQKKLAGPDSVG